MMVNNATVTIIMHARMERECMEEKESSLTDFVRCTLQREHHML